MRLYRLLLYVYPAAFRHEYAACMIQVFEERRRQASGPIQRLAFWAWALWDVASNAVRVHWDILCQDLHVTARSVRRNSGFAFTVTAVTALGIGATTATFSITDHVLIRPLPFADDERLVKLYERPPGYTRMELSPPNYRDWRDLSASFEGMAAYHHTAANLVGAGDPQRLLGAAVTADLLPLLGARPHFGRLFHAEDETDGAPQTVLLSQDLWQRTLGGDERILGRALRLNDVTYTVVGVMPPGFVFPRRQTSFWVPLRLYGPDSEDRDNNELNVLAKLGPGVTLQAARAEMTGIAERLENEYPEANADTGATVIPLRDEMSEHSRLLLLALFGASTCVLLIACLNLANLLLVRSLGRRREMVLRTAIGAGRERLVRQLLTESLVLALGGGVLGVAAAFATVPLLAQLVPSSLPIGDASVLDPRVLLFAVLLTVVTGVAFGVLPALKTCRGVEATELLASARSVVGGQSVRLRSALVAAEVAASIVLLVASGLLIRALWRVQAIDPGFTTDNVLTLSTPLPRARYGETAKRARLYNQVLGDVRALPGVSSAAYISFLPMTTRGGIWPVAVDGVQDDGKSDRASLRYVTPDFFDTLGIPIEAGRDVGDADTDERPSVAVVSRSFASRYWPGSDPVGREFNFAFRDRRVVGVVGDVRFRGLERASEPQVYLPFMQVPDRSILGYVPQSLVVRTAGDPLALVTPIRRIVRRADPQLPVTDVQPLKDIVGRQTAPRSTQIRVLGAFAGLALLLAGLGIHGLLAYTVSQRTAEIGLRMALGARRRDVWRMVLRQGTLLAAIGGAFGLGLAYAAGRSMEALLAGLRPADLATFAAALLLVLTTVVTGCLLPALRASRVDPTIALRAM